jgi:hypothetical protein
LPGQARQVGLSGRSRLCDGRAIIRATTKRGTNLILESRAQRVSSALPRRISINYNAAPIDSFVSVASFTARAAANENGNKTAPIPAGLISLSRGRVELHFAFICFDNAPRDIQCFYR